jgi:hypothetical protein
MLCGASTRLGDHDLARVDSDDTSFRTDRRPAMS